MPRRPVRPVAALVVALGALAACAGGASDGAADGPSAPVDARLGATDGPDSGVDGGPPSSAATASTTSVPATTTTAPPTPAECAARLPEGLLIGQVLMPIAAPAELAGLEAAARDGAVAGVALLGSPTATDLADLVGLDEVGPVPLLVASDEEGGRVQRLAGVLGPLPSARAAAGLPEPERRSVYQAYASGLAGLGVDLVFAPVVDVGGGPGIGDRAYGADPATVSAGARSYVEALQGAGVLPTLKHFPGHGRASADTHLGLASTPPWPEMQDVDLVPYRELIDGGPLAVMVGHLTVPGLTGDLPASLSTAAIEGVLRGELGHHGLIVTDSLTMDAITDRWPLGDAGALALAAGADLLVFAGPGRVPEVAAAIGAALADGSLARARLVDAAVRVLGAKGVEPCVLVDPAPRS